MKANEIIVFMVLIVAAFLCVAMSPVEAALGFGREGTTIEQKATNEELAELESTEGDNVEQNSIIIIAYCKDRPNEVWGFESLNQFAEWLEQSLQHRREYVALTAQESIALEIERICSKENSFDHTKWLEDIPDEYVQEIAPVLGTEEPFGFYAKWYDPHKPRKSFIQKGLEEVQKWIPLGNLLGLGNVSSLLNIWSWIR